MYIYNSGTVHQLSGVSIISLSLQAYHVPLNDLQVHSSAFLANLLALVDPSLESWGKACIKSIATRRVSKSRRSQSNIYYVVSTVLGLRIE